MRDKLFFKPVHMCSEEDSTRLQCLPSNGWSSQHEPDTCVGLDNLSLPRPSVPIDLEDLHVTEIVELSLPCSKQQGAATPPPGLEL